MRTGQRLRVVVAMAFAALPAGAAALELSSPVFSAGGAIPSRYTCDGENVSPPLAWGDPPADTKSFALVVDDPDAPDPAAPRMRWVHWVLFDLPAETRGLKEGIRSVTDLPAGTKVGSNDWGNPTWSGPCPPTGRHRYVFTLYALDTELTESTALSKRSLEEAMAGHILAHTILMGTYERPK
jgi:Raf kinase inhibitor-like YbhB/YbcL family protein